MKVFVAPTSDVRILQLFREGLQVAGHAVGGFAADNLPALGPGEHALARFREVTEADVLVGLDDPDGEVYYAMAAGQEKMIVLVTSHEADDRELNPALTLLPNVVTVPSVRAAIEAVDQYQTSMRILDGVVLATSKQFGKVVPLSVLFRGATPKFQGEPLEWALIFSGTFLQLNQGELDPEVYRRVVELTRDMAAVGSSFEAVREALVTHLNKTVGESYREVQLSGPAGEPTPVPAPSDGGASLPSSPN